MKKSKKTKIAFTIILMLMLPLLVGQVLPLQNNDTASALTFEGNVYIVESYTSFAELCFYNNQSAANFKDKEVSLRTDIYLKGKDLKLTGFLGTFNGNNHAIVGCSGTSGLFDNATGTIRNLNFYDAEGVDLKTVFGSNITKFEDIKIFGRETTDSINYVNKVYVGSDNAFVDTYSPTSVNNLFDLVAAAINDQKNLTFNNNINVYSVDLNTYFGNFKTEFTFGYGDFLPYNDAFDIFAIGKNEAEVTIDNTIEVAPVTPSGNGTKIDPYNIQNIGNLQFIADMADTSDKYFLQTADITLKAADKFCKVTSLNFLGNYNGGDYSISYLTNPLFDSIGGNVYNLNIIGQSVTNIFVNTIAISGSVENSEFVFMQPYSGSNGYMIGENLGKIANVRAKSISNEYFVKSNGKTIGYAETKTVKLAETNSGNISNSIVNASDNVAILYNSGEFQILNNANKNVLTKTENSATEMYYAGLSNGELVMPYGLEDKFVLGSLRYNQKTKINSNLLLLEVGDSVYSDGMESYTSGIITAMYTNVSFFSGKTVIVSINKDEKILVDAENNFVGKYDVNIQVDCGNEYTAVAANKTFTVKKATFSELEKANFQTELDKLKITYAAKENYAAIKEKLVEIVNSALYEKPGLTINLSAEKNGIVDYTMKDAGTYDLELSVENENYETFKISDLSFNIATATLYIDNAEIKDIQFSEKPVVGYTPSGLYPGDKIDDTYIKFTTNYKYTATERSDIGDYYFDVSIAEGNRYKLNPNYYAQTRGNNRQTFKVSPKALNMPDDIVKNEELVYNGSLQGFADFSTALNSLSKTLFTTITATYTKVKDVKYIDNAVTVHSIVITFVANNYIKSILTKEIKILPYAITFAADNKVINYLADKPTSFSFKNSGLAGGDISKPLQDIFGGSISYDTIYEKGNDAGSYPIVISGLTSTNYLIKYSEGNLEVKKILFGFTLTNSSKDFDNLEYVPRLNSGDRSDVNYLYYNGHLMSINGETPIVTPKNAGKYTIKATFAETTNYLESSKLFSITISKIKLSLIVGNFEFTYDKTGHTITFELPGGGNFGTKYTVSVNQSQYETTILIVKDAGQYTVNMSIKDSLNNYEDFSKEFSITIKRIALTIEGNNKLTYNGQEQTPIFNIVSGLIEGDIAELVCKAEADAEIKNVRSYTVIVTTRNTNYVVSDDIQTITIDPYKQTLDLSEKNFIFAYGNNVILPNETKNINFNGTQISVEISYTHNVGLSKDVGLYNIKSINIVTAEHQGQIVFSIKGETGKNTIEIVPKEISYTINYDKSYDYNGNVRENLVSVSDVDGLAYGDILQFWFVPNKEIKNVGSYTVQITFDNNNYFVNESLRSVEIAIEKIAATIKYQDKEIVFYSKLPKTDYIFSGFLKGENPIEIVDFENIITETVYFVGANCAQYVVRLKKLFEEKSLAQNYQITLQEGIVTVIKAIITDVRAESVEKVYTGSKTFAKLVGNTQKYNVTFSLEPINVGEYAITVTFSDKNEIQNYNDLVINDIKIKITPATVRLTVEDISTDYAANTKLDNKIIKGVAEFGEKEVKGTFEFENNLLIYGENEYVIKFKPSSANFANAETKLKITSKINIEAVYVYVIGEYDEKDGIYYSNAAISIMISDSIYDENLKFYYNEELIEKNREYVFDKSVERVTITLKYLDTIVGEYVFGKVVIDENYKPSGGSGDDGGDTDEDPPTIVPDKKANYSLIYGIIGGVVVVLVLGAIVTVVARRKK